jgi:putative membrane protein
MKFYRIVLTLLLAVSLTGFTACQRNDKGVEAAREDTIRAHPEDSTTARLEDTFTSEEQASAMKIEQANMAEMDLARLAMDRASNQEVKDYANTIERDHQDAMDRLIKMFKDQNVTLTTPPKTAEHLANVDKLKKLSGAEFDREFLTMMVQTHQTTLNFLNQEKGKARNADFQKYLNDVIPKVQSHLEKAQELQKKMIAGAKR